MSFTTSRLSNRVSLTAIAASAAMTIVMMGVGSASAVISEAAATTVPPARILDLVSTAEEVTANRRPGQGFIPLDLGAFLVAHGSPFEIQVKRASYHQPIHAHQVIRVGRHNVIRPLPMGLLTDFLGFPGFFELSLADAAGTQVLTATPEFCPNGQQSWFQPGPRPAPPPYPFVCPGNHFTLGSVWGIAAGWGVPATLWTNVRNLPDGVYTATLRIAASYRHLFNVADETVSVRLRLRTAQPAIAQGSVTMTAPPIRAQGTVTAPPRDQRPDLRSLPAWAISTDGDSPHTPQVEPDRLTFAATIWNAGPAPLVVDGFRRPDEAVMDSYQRFYDSHGNETGAALVGAMHWHPAQEHHHWHFEDFAGYRLLDSRFREVTRSLKEAFCLANTDAVDMFVPNAVWQPENTDLHTSCGTEDSTTIRQVLATGHGDTYPNSAPGRAFNLTGLPNGTYFIQIIANPDGRLYEENSHNNSSHRQVIISGVPGSRTVTVPPYGLVNSDPS